MIEYYRRPIPPSIKRELRELHAETLPADTMPSFRADNAAVVRRSGEAVAYITFRRKRARLWIDRIGVCEEWRGEGLAAALLDFARSNTKVPVDTYIAASNVDSQRLFISRGFMPYATFEEDKQMFIRFTTDMRKAPK